MAIKITDDQNYADIAEAIRELDGSDETFLPSEMADAIVSGRDSLLDRVAITKTASGAVASFDDGADRVPVKSLVVNIEPVQEGEGDPSPDNVRPIKGWTAATVKRYGIDESDNLETVTVDFGEAGTVYGGTLDVVTGELSVNMVYKECTEFRLESGYHAGNSYLFSAGGFSDAAGRVPFKNSTSKSDKFSWETEILNRDLTGFYIGYSMLWARIVGVSDLADFMEAISNSLTVVYPIASPITYHLTPTQIRTLLGTNHIYADAGDVDVTYRADPTLAYEHLLEQTGGGA